MLARMAFILKANLYVGDMELESKSKHGVFQIFIVENARYSDIEIESHTMNFHWVIWFK